MVGVFFHLCVCGGDGSIIINMNFQSLGGGGLY